MSDKERYEMYAKKGMWSIAENTKEGSIKFLKNEDYVDYPSAKLRLDKLNKEAKKRKCA